MSPGSGDGSQLPEARSVGGLASVFKGLTSSKSSKTGQPAPASSSIPTTQLSSDHIDATLPNPNPRGLPPNHTETFEKLKNGSLYERVAAANTLRYAIADYPLSPVLDIWYAGKDLIQRDNPPNVRVAGWELLSECVNHRLSTDLERREFFQTLSAPADPDDFHLQLAAIVDLTKHGRDLSGFDYDVIPLLTRWLRDTYRAVKSARKHAPRPPKGSKGKAPLSGEDKNFSQLFSFILDVIKFNFKVADDQAVGGLIDVLLEICMSTNSEEDLRACIDVTNAIITFGSIPAENLSRCVKVLSSIYCLVQSLQKDSWHAMANLCKSHHGQTTVQILLNVLRRYPLEGTDLKEANREVRGALSALQKLVAKNAGKGYPQVPLALLIDGLVNVVEQTSSQRIVNEALKLVNSLFDDGDRKIHPALVEEDWSTIFGVAATCARKAGFTPPGDAESVRSHGSLGKDDAEKGEEPAGSELRRLAIRLEEILKERRSDLIQRQDCINFFAKIHQNLQDSAVGLVLDYFKEFRCCFPSDLHWEENLRLVLDSFFLNRQRSTLTRLRALEIVTEVYGMLELVEDAVDAHHVPDLVRTLLAGIGEETDTLLLQDTVSFLVSVATSADTELFDFIFDTLKGIVANDRLSSAMSSPVASGPARSADRPGYFANQSPSNVVTRGYVQIFMKTMNIDVRKAIKSFNSLVHIARSNSCESDARLTAMRLLFRLRADYANRIFITSDVESEGLANTLYRTEGSLARKLADDAAHTVRSTRSEQGPPSRTSRGTSFGQGQAPERLLPIRSASTAKAPTPRYQQLWAVPDADALPEQPTLSASPVLFSHFDHATVTDGFDFEQSKRSLGMATWLEAVTSLFYNGCGGDWEVYSFILVHLPSQLSNHAIFRDAIAQVQDIRKLLCEQIRTNTFVEPPSSSGLRRPEILICLYHTLTMILSYHEHFHKSDEDEIVRTFMQGIGDKTAVACIHALSMCCHEVPLSTSKCLVTILQKMSQIITRPAVAMHILEFLVGLSRLPKLYSNFREDEYRIVFGISFGYLRTVRDGRRGSRASHPSEPLAVGAEPAGRPSASDDLPQYVYALAYHVITFWFIALKLPDRVNQVGWIASRLFTDNDGRQISDEQAQTTLDFMQRIAFSDADDSIEDPLFTEQNFGKISEKRWLVGHSIVTIKQAAEAGWAQITKRQPSGTSSYTIRESFRPPPAHQSNLPSDTAIEAQQLFSNTVLPSHLLVQLLSSTPQANDSTLRPIPLPDDEIVGRAIRTFDRISTVDGHKVGVVYIGEGQTEETAILSNVSGSSDYVEFLNGLGTLVKLKGATFNTQGLDREHDTDGQFTFAWRDRVTELVFHVTTQMPTNLDHDPLCINKKKHIGNDFVNIMFNDSGLPFRFDTFPSEFNYVNIVITPESRASFVASREQSGAAEEGGSATETKKELSSFFRVQVMSKPGFPEISPAAETKMVSLKALPGFVRLLALSASVFSLVWANREGGDNVSSWRNRLREINRLRDRYGPKTPSQGTTSPPSTSMGGPNAASMSMSHHPQQFQQQQAMQQSQSQTLHVSDNSRPPSSVRDSFSSLRRSSVATFFTTTSEQTSHRSSTLSTAPTDNTEIMQTNGADSIVDSLDFSKWA
ncbi:uncharacterized protein E0L32_008175 [Thyridium curvatum]|uniref:Rap-GAP domain-containing protein n=1 Tax=Thyridium curvatum TaxID=1093900 RepID=A0A507B122_9PEZI|nr:uncharacterized protein E0L32_008175 [Thyridium curvatum]TPX10969.1 hypothetical protein E0L32_008175 [Thyridium curvatum]